MELVNYKSAIKAPDYEKISDPEGQAALEETRAIILLSQVYFLFGSYWDLSKNNLKKLVF